MNETPENLLRSVSTLATDDSIWSNHHFIWKAPSTWVPQLSAWLTPRFRADGRRLKPGIFRDLCWDDRDWSRVLEKCLVVDIDFHTGKLAEALEHATLRTYHGCRTDDAGDYYRGGLRIHDRSEMAMRLQAIVDAHPELTYLKSRLPEAIATIKNALDIGCLYVVADDQSLVKHAAHYLIYGSEWISAVLGHSYRHVLKKNGAPTLLEIDLPFRVGSLATRNALAANMIREWTRLTCNQSEWSAPIDFTFPLRTNIPPEWIVGHSHPRELVDPLEHYSNYRVPNPECAHCRAR